MRTSGAYFGPVEISHDSGATFTQVTALGEKEWTYVGRDWCLSRRCVREAWAGADRGSDQGAADAWREEVPGGQRRMRGRERWGRENSSKACSSHMH